MSKSLSAARFSIGVNVVLSLLKGIVALRTGSVGLLAEVLHSLLDLLASGLAFIGIRLSEAPPDENHHYGHYRFENVSALAQVILIILTALFLFLEAWGKLVSPQPLAETDWGILLMLLSLAVAWYTSRKLNKVARQEKSPAIVSDAYHFTTDVWSGLAVLFGLVFAHFGYPIADPLAAIVVGFVMLHGSLRLARESVLSLTDVAPDKRILSRISATLSHHRRVTSFHKLRARRSGKKVFADVHVRLKRGTKLEAAHKVAHEVKAQIMEGNPQLEDVHIHLEPEPRSHTKKRIKR